MPAVSMRFTFSTKILNNGISSSKASNFFHSKLHTCLAKQSRISSEKVTEIFRTNEYSLDLKENESCVKFYESNQLPSNSPMEDGRSEAKCLLSKGMLFGVFDGHGGPACAQILTKRLLDYICVGLLPKNILRQYAQSLDDKEPPIDLLEKYNESFDLLPELNCLYRKSFNRYVRNLVQEDKEEANAHVAMEKAALCLDEDLSVEALNCEIPEMAQQTMQVAMSGSVCCVVHIDGCHLHVANIGDCRAVLGVLTKDNVWEAKSLTRDHNYENKAEIKRIISEHPTSESGTVIHYGRLLGQLAPLRAFGDFSYKWSTEVLNQLVNSGLYPKLVKESEMMQWERRAYFTPPYLTAKPEVTHHELTSDDKFLIIGTDGLWDKISSLEAVRNVAAHLRARFVLYPFRVPREDMKLGEIHKLLLQRKQYSDVKPVDRNGATHLLRKALGSWPFLDANTNSSRYFRDDITITIVYFESTYPS